LMGRLGLSVNEEKTALVKRMRPAAPPFA